jgi:hypothetical protein
VPVSYDDLFEEGEIHEEELQNWSIPEVLPLRALNLLREQG